MFFASSYKLNYLIRVRIINHFDFDFIRIFETKTKSVFICLTGYCSGKDIYIYMFEKTIKFY